MSEPIGQPAILQPDGAGGAIDPVTGEPLGSLLDLPGVQAGPPMTGLTIGGTTINLTSKAWGMIALGALAIVGLIVMRED